MQQVTNRDGVSVSVLELSDVDPVIDAALGRFTRRAVVIVVGAVISVTLGFAVLRGDVTSTAREVERIDRQGSQPVQVLRAQVDSMRIEMRHLPRDVVEELRRQGLR